MGPCQLWELDIAYLRFVETEVVKGVLCNNHDLIEG